MTAFSLNHGPSAPKNLIRTQISQIGPHYVHVMLLVIFLTEAQYFRRVRRGMYVMNPPLNQKYRLTKSSALPKSLLNERLSCFAHWGPECFIG